MTKRIGQVVVTEVQSDLTDRQVEEIAVMMERNPSPEEELESIYSEIEFVTSTGVCLRFRSHKVINICIRHLAKLEALMGDLRYKEIANSNSFFIAACLAIVQVTDTVEEYRGRGAYYTEVNIEAIMDMNLKEFKNFVEIAADIPAVKALMDEVYANSNEPEKKD